MPPPFGWGPNAPVIHNPTIPISGRFTMNDENDDDDDGDGDDNNARVPAPVVLMLTLNGRKVKE